jgi:hypothetical protein
LVTDFSRTNFARGRFGSLVAEDCVAPKLRAQYRG